MINTLAFVHTSHVLIPAFAKLAKEILPDMAVFHTVDESLIRNTIQAGRLTKDTTRRVVQAIESAHEGGADAVLVTCSSIGPAVTVARQQFEFPILRVDEAMAERAVRMGRRIGVAATISTTLEPTMALLRDTAAEAARDVELIPVLCEGAFAAVVSGDTGRHDTLVSEALERLTQEADVVVLAQASMARVVERVNAGSTPILASPELAVRRAQELFRPVATSVGVHP